MFEFITFLFEFYLIYKFENYILFDVDNRDDLKLYIEAIRIVVAEIGTTRF